jgi:hypothetical protein
MWVGRWRYAIPALFYTIPVSRGKKNPRFSAGIFNIIQP